MFGAFFFDLDGTLFDSMAHHAQAWEEVMTRHGLSFSAYDCYVNEGRTGQDVIHEAIWRKEHREATEEEIWRIYREKTEAFRQKGETGPIAGASDVLAYLQSKSQLWIVTGSGQQTLFDQLDGVFPGVFTRERMITAYDVVKGKPDPEPYIRAWERSGLKKEDCCVVENAPLGIISGKAAGLYAVAINTGVLDDDLLWKAGADQVFKSMADFLKWLQEQ